MSLTAGRARETALTRAQRVMRDASAGDTTYRPGRFLYVEKAPEPGKPFVLDLNRIYNPPCAFSEFTTCPLPPEQNILKVRVEAGKTRMEIAARLPIQVTVASMCSQKIRAITQEAGVVIVYGVGVSVGTSVGGMNSVVAVGSSVGVAG